MFLNDSIHTERFNEMKHDVNARFSEWWLYFKKPRNGEINEDIRAIIDTLKSDLMAIGPFGHTFVKENRSTFKRELYDIPLQHVFVDENDNNFEALAYVATNDHHSVLLKSVFDFLRRDGQRYDFANLNLTAVCVQYAFSNSDEKVVYSVECLEGLQPLSYYEHPLNGRLFMAMGGLEYPEHSILTFHGKTKPLEVPLTQMLEEVNQLYEAFEYDNITSEELSTKLYSYFEEKK